MLCDKKMTSLVNFCRLMAESISVEGVLPTIIEMVAIVMDLEIVFIYLLEAESRDLVLLTYRGVSSEFAQEVDRIKLGEGFNGRVAETGEAMLMTNAANDPHLSMKLVQQENVQAEIIVPMKSKGRVIGTICAATRRKRQFLPEEIELTIAIGNKSGIALENASLLQEQLAMTERMQQSEANYKELFQNASDAIWVHDLEGNLKDVNKACENLTGYSADEMSCMKVTQFLAPDALNLAGEVKNKLLKGETINERYEQHILRRDGTDATIELATRLITKDDEPVGFENIARDVTEERRMRDNLRFYLKEVLNAQEEERKRLSRDLHDDVAQSLLLMIRQLDELISDPHRRFNKPTKEALERIFDLTIKTHGSLRDYAQSLRPDILDQMGLIPTLEWMAENLRQEYGMKVNVESYGSEDTLSPEVKLVFFRIAQEAMSNIRRHSGATNVSVKLQCETGKAMMTITDDGKGFEVPQHLGDLISSGRLGLTGMEERAKLLGASMSVQSELGKGTTVTIEAAI